MPFFSRLLRYSFAVLLLSLPACMGIPRDNTRRIEPPPGPMPTPQESVASTSEAPARVDTVFRVVDHAQFVQDEPLFPTDECCEEIPKDFWDGVKLDCDLSKEDFGHFYTEKRNLLLWAFGVGVAGALANSSADQDIQDWYQEDVTSESMDDLAEVVNVVGQYWFVVPLGMEIMAWHGKFSDDYWRDGGFTEWGHRSLRAVAVGYPSVIAMYGLLGAGRPDRHDSRWHPFKDIRGVSGHTFMGAIPFLTAARMTDDPRLKATMVVGSFLTGWSRIHKERHYFSQVALGWWMAYLSVRCVDLTQSEHQNWTVTPSMINGAPGMAVHVEY